ncbi:MAG: DUF3419 family protein [Candidatus Pacebacteria bacterium]|nr:DUF3419 family protein [Candidatus Paceibacterota bacterium]
MKSAVINYSQCWEDPHILLSALQVSNDDIVLSITSGGDNALAILTEKPARVISIDSNNLQNYLLELKLAAIANLGYRDSLKFLGAERTTDRSETFKKIQNSLSVETRSWWQKNHRAIDAGVINCGRFEKFLKLFSKLALPTIHSQKITSEFLNISDIEQQKKFYDNIWNTWKWRLFFKIFSNKLVLKKFARQKGIFEYADVPNIGDIYFKRFQNNLRTISLRDNYFMHYCLTGFYNLESLPPYLNEINKDAIIEGRNKLNIATGDIFDYLKSIPNGYFSKFNLSDVFELLSEDKNDRLWEEIVRTSKNGAIAIYWNNLVKRTFPSHLSKNVFDDVATAEKMHKIDKAPFYGSLYINRITK